MSGSVNRDKTIQNILRRRKIRSIRKQAVAV
jgi:hypothetical protein